MAKYTSDSKLIALSVPASLTMMTCDGGGEQIFLQMMKKINNYFIDKNDKLNLNIDEIPMMRFKKNNK